MSNSFISNFYTIDKCVIKNIEYVNSINKLDGNGTTLNHYTDTFFYLGQLPKHYINKTVKIRYESIKINNRYSWVDTINII